MAEPDAPPPLQDWLGSRQVCEDPMPPFPARALAALLGLDPPEHAAPLPLPWHWLYAIVPPGSGETGVDGHPARGGFLPPVALPRRMWAASEVTITRPLTIGIPAQRCSTVTDIAHKHGRSGELIFVTVDHQWTQDGEACLTERQTIVYRDAVARASSAAEPTAVSDDPGTLRGTVSPDSVMLFRYSALTYNAHRIHYDPPYARDEEGYPDLVVHGPLIATLLLAAARPLLGDERPMRFSFRAERPAFAGRPLGLHARRDDQGLSMWSTDPQGHPGVRARLDLSATEDR